jgi:DNA polymerase-3 subunit delta'
LPLDDLFGNARIKHILSSYLKNDVIPYSLIFNGPGSAGMLNFAVAFAKAINCLEMKHDFCGHCSHCVEVEKDIFLDLKILSPDGQFYKKEQILFLIDDNFNKPIKGEKKINILTDAHRMNENSANTFLKVLEEPASSNIFILLSNNMNGLLPTIKSRCQILTFSPLCRSEVKKYLTDQGFDEEKARLISYLSQNNIEGVLSVNYDEFMEKRTNIIVMLDKLIKRNGIEDILLDFYQRSRVREKFINYFKELVNLISLLLRDIMILLVEKEELKKGTDISLRKYLINIDFERHLLELREYISIDKILFLIKKMELLLRDIHRNLNTKVLILEFINSYTINEVKHV